MTIETSYVPLSYAGNAVTNSFAITFDYQLASQIVAKTEVVATGVITDLVYGTDFTVTPNVNSPASFGTLTLLLGSLPNGTNILITRVTDVTQDTSWINNSANPASAFENAVDKLTMIDQEREVTPFDLDGTTDQFLRGDNTLTNTLVGPSGAFVLPADTTAMFIAGQKANASIKVVSGAAGQGAFSFGVDGSSNPWDMRWVYDASLPALGWQVFGQSIRGTFDNTGLDVTGTVNATLFTGAADASLITTGLLATARMGSGSATSSSVLYGDQTWRVVTGDGGGINTTTTGTFVIAAANSTQTVPVTSATGIVAGTELQISDGTHQIIGLVTVVASLNLTVKTQQIVLGTAGNTMASGAAVQSSSVPGNNTVLMSDLDHTTPFGVSYMFLTGAESQAISPLPNVDLFFLDVIGSTVQLAGSSNRNFLLESIHSGTTAKDQLAWKPLGSTNWNALFSPSATGDVVRSTDGTTIGFGKITASDSITAATITPALLNCTNSLTDTELFGYDSASGHFKMFPNPNVGSGTTAQFYRGDNTFTNSLTGPINIDLSSSTTFRIGVANIFGGSTPVQAYMEPVVSGTPTVLPLQIASQLFLGSGQYNTIDSTTSVEFLQVNGIARATSWRSTNGPWLKIFELGTGGGATTIDLNNGNYQRFTNFGSNVTITLADTSPLPTAQRFTSELTLEFNAMSTFDVTWPGTITWANSGIAPTVANSGLNASGINVVKLIRRQGQTQWVGFVENPSTSGSGSVTSITAGTGLSGGTITTSGTIAIATGGVTTSLIANLAVTSAQIANNTITNGQIANNTVTVGNIQGGTAAGGNSSLFLNAGGTWTAPSGGGGGGGPTLSSNNPWSGVNSWSNTSTFSGATIFGHTGTFNAKQTFNGPQVFTSNGFGSPVGSSLTGQISINNFYPNDNLNPETAAGLRMTMTNNFVSTGQEIQGIVATITTTSDGDAQGGVAKFWSDYLGDLSTFATFAIPLQAIGSYRNVNGGSADSVWFNAWGPCNLFASTPDATGVTHSFGGGDVRIGECNYGNAWADFGFIDDRADGTRWVAGLEFFPAWLAGSTGAVNPNFYNASWAIAIGGWAPGANAVIPRNWTGLLFSQNGIAPGGIGINMHANLSTNTTTTGTFTIAAVGATQTVPVTSVLAGAITVGTDLIIRDGTHKIYGHVTVVASLNLTFVTDAIYSGSAGNTMASAAIVEDSPAVGINLQDTFVTGINFAGSGGGAPVGAGGGTAATFTSTGAAAITLAVDQSIKFGPIWVRGHGSGSGLQYSSNGTSWTDFTLP